MKRALLPIIFVLVLSFVILPASSVEAATVTWSGTLIDNPDILDASLGSCAAGTRLQEAYDLVPFYVDTTANYNIVITAAAGMPNTPDDTLIALYQDSFAGDWATNCIGVNDDDIGWLSGFNAMPLTAGTQYILLVTYAWQGFGDGIGATYDAQIDGAGEICLGALGACDAPAVVDGLNVPNNGLVLINSWEQTAAYDGPAGSQVKLSNGALLILPQDYDGNGYDTYVVTETVTVDGQAWVSIFIGNESFVWVPWSAVHPASYFD